MLGLVIAGETVNAGFDEDEAELRVLVLAVRLEVLAHGDSLLDQMPEVLRYGRCKAWASRTHVRTAALSTHRNEADAPFDLRTRRILFPVTKRT